MRKVLPDGQPMLRRARIRQRGTFLLSPPNGWQPFDAVHTATVGPAGFVWDARIRMGPALAASVRDAYVGGAGRDACRRRSRAW